MGECEWQMPCIWMEELVDVRGAGAYPQGQNQGDPNAHPNPEVEADHMHHNIVCLNSMYPDCINREDLCLLQLSLKPNHLEGKEANMQQGWSVEGQNDQ